MRNLMRIIENAITANQKLKTAKNQQIIAKSY